MHLVDPNHENNDKYDEETKLKALTLMFKYQSLQAKLRDSKREFLLAGQSF